MRNSRKPVVKVGLLIGCLFYSLDANAATIKATTCTAADVGTAVTAASTGDTVVIPACASTAWANPITITKPITIQGAGAGVGEGGVVAGTAQTLISGNAFDVRLTTDGPVRITGIAFSRTTWGSGDSMINITGKNSAGNGTAMTQVRIDHCRFTNGGRQIQPTGWAYGVIDNNRFINANIAVGLAGDNTFAWERPIAAGTANAMFIESNTFFVDNGRFTGGGGNANNEQVYHQEGARSVVRYNTFTFTQTNDVTAVIDTHGNDFSYFQNNRSTDFRGQPLIELYNNTVTSTGNWYYWIHQRGGSILSHDNTITVAGSPQPYILFDEYEARTGSPVRTVWPGQDQVYNSFYWNETFNGHIVTSSDFNWYTPAIENFIQLNRDFFLHAPQANGGKQCFVAPGETSNCANMGRAGGSAAPPTQGDTGNMIFVASGANAYYPYTPYTYPHPLATGISATDTVPPNSPTNLRVQ